jgi:hypothetical protein
MSTSDALPPDDRWSASFDGEADDEPRDAAARQARDTLFASWAALGEELRAVTPPDDDTFDALRRGVLDAVAAERPRAAHAAPARVARWRRPLGAAAAVLVAAGFVAVLVRQPAGDDDASRSARTEAGSAAVLHDAAGVASTGATGSAAATGSTGASGSGAASSTADAPKAAGSAGGTAPVDLGTRPTLDALFAAYAATRGGAAPPTDPATTRPATPPAPSADCGRVLAVATLGTTRVQIVTAPQGAVVVDAQTCAVVALVP